MTNQRKSWKMRTRRKKKEATFPAQALSCSGSTGIISAKSFHLWVECFSTPGTLENRFSAGNAKIGNRKLFLTSYKSHRMQHPVKSVVFYQTIHHHLKQPS
jgi:hypothetical protein